MTPFERINDIIDGYIVRCRELIAAAKPGAGLFGMGDDPRKDVCHEQFFNELERTVHEIAQGKPTPEEAYPAVSLLLKASKEKDCPDMTAWMLTAAQKLSLPLIPFLTPEQRAELLAWYEKAVPRRIRLPAQKEVYQRLGKA